MPRGQRDLQMLDARETTLRADKAYIDLLEAESTWPFKYVFSRTNAVNPRLSGAPCSGVPARNINAYNTLLPTHFRVQTRASQNRPQTELFGTAPYTALGRGPLKHIDTSSLLQQSNRVTARGARTVTEIDMNRRDFVSVPKELTALPYETRYGRLTRAGPAYMQPHD